MSFSSNDCVPAGDRVHQQERLQSPPLPAESPSTTHSALDQRFGSEEMDGYRSSCEGSDGDEGCQLCADTKDTVSNDQVLKPLAAAATADAGVNAAVASEESGKLSSSLTLPPHHSARGVHPRPYSGVVSAAREAERQQLIAMSSPEGEEAILHMAPSRRPASESLHKSTPSTPQLHITNASTHAPPLTLAEASAAESEEEEEQGNRGVAEKGEGRSGSSKSMRANSHTVFASSKVNTAAAMMCIAINTQGSPTKAFAAAEAPVASDGAMEPSSPPSPATTAEAAATSPPSPPPSAPAKVSSSETASAYRVSAQEPSCAAALMRVPPPPPTGLDLFATSPAAGINGKAESSTAASTGTVPPPKLSSAANTFGRLSQSSSSENSAVEAPLDPITVHASVSAGPGTPVICAPPSSDRQRTALGNSLAETSPPRRQTPEKACPPFTSTTTAATAVTRVSTSSHPLAPVSAGTTPPPEVQTTTASAQRAAATAERSSTTATATNTDVTQVADMTFSHDSQSPSNHPSITTPASPPPSNGSSTAITAQARLAPPVDVSSSSSVGGHHLSVTEGNAFLKQSGSRREEAFYNMIQPYQEILVREAVRKAPQTVEHWKRQTVNSASAAGARHGEDIESACCTVILPAAASTGKIPSPTPTTRAAATTTSTTTGVSHVHVDAASFDGTSHSTTTAAAAAVSAPASVDDSVNIGEARWEAYQQYEAADFSSLDILAAAPPRTVAEDEAQQVRLRRGTVTAVSPRTPSRQNTQEGSAHCHDSTTAEDGVVVTVGAATASSSAASPLYQVDKVLVELAARIWWTVRFRHFYRTASAAYEVQRLAAEAAAVSPPSPATSVLQTLVRETGGGGGLVVSRSSTPVSQIRLSGSSVITGQQSREDLMVAATMATPPLMHTPPLAASPASPSVVHVSTAMLVGAVSGAATPSAAGSFAAPSTSEEPVTNAVLAERQYAVQKHRALQLLAAFVPRYHGTRRLFVKEVLQFERRAAAAATVRAAAAAAAGRAAAQRTSVDTATAADVATKSSAPSAGITTTTTTTTTGTVTGATTTAVAPPARRILDADNEDEEDCDEGENGSTGGKKICRMIMLEYVCFQFRRPCVMDMKMGSRQYGLHPSPEKKQSKEKKAKLSTSARYGIRLAGYRRWTPAESRYAFRGKLQCRCLTLNEVKEEMSAFFQGSRELELVFRRQLQRLRVAFSQQTVFRFYTSSLLFVYDAADPLTTARVTMVDFAYTYESRELLQGGDPDAEFAYDVGYLKAIDTLLSLLA